MRFLNLVHKYQRDIDHLKQKLGQKPEDWPIYQKYVDECLGEVFSLCARFENDNLNDEMKVYKLKRLFQDYFGEYFKIGKYTKWVCEKPLGYAGDYQIIEWIYQNQANTTGIERCSDNYFLRTAASIATRNRKEDFKKILFEQFNLRGDGIKIMNLACGPCRDIYEFCKETDKSFSLITCVDHDLNAIQYAKNLLKDVPQKNQIEFIQKNVVKIALTKNIESMFPSKYDVIFSTGLFDYLNFKVAVRLIQNLKALLKEDGLLIISNYRDRLSNPSRLYMEWGGNWELIYRTEKEFLKIFEEAGFPEENLLLEFESQKVMQYCIAKNNA